jgi:hypothetical protein
MRLARIVILSGVLIAPLTLGACDYLPDSVKALVSRPQTAVTGAYKNSSFKGQLKVLFLEPQKPEDRGVQLLEPFGYKDSKGVDWDVPAGFVSDGASIPWSLWPFVGGPFDGPHRDAAVLHDYYCEKRTRTWEEVHAMFLEASLRRGVPVTTAQTMYAGILYGGPRWDPPTLQRAQILPGAGKTPPPADPGITNRKATATEKQRFEDLKTWIEREKPTPEQIMKRGEEMRAAEGKPSKAAPVPAAKEKK